MRSARTLLATAATSAVLVLGAPGAYAASGDWNHDDSSYSKEQDHGSKQDGPRGGMHTGGGALTLTPSGDWGGSGEKEKEGDSGEKGESRENGGREGDESRENGGREGDSSREKGEHEGPRGGMHTGGGALTLTPSGDWGGSGEKGESRENGGREGDESRENGGREGDSSREKGEHEGPRGGMHTGGGALTVANEGDWGGSGSGSGEGGKSWGGGEQEKPRGGMHTGGGGLSQQGATAGGLAVLAVAATGLYAARRRKSAHGAA
ncbi:hypothetical protein AB0O68_22375 [Streptomyces sp. NPDC087512]|uniref:hypothetical protein n=1 Tax=Streptomyces sp. NPDC087512 TaxID=3155059 RepID=UPI00343C09AD